MTLVCLTALVLTASQPTTLEGKVHVAGTGNFVVVSLKVADGQPVSLAGDPVLEIQRLHSMIVQVSGTQTAEGMRVKSYSILDIGRGAKPLVGVLVQTPLGFALQDGDGTPIALNLPPRSQRRLGDQVGARLWVHGKSLLSGQIKVQRYGILREPLKQPSKAAPKPDPAAQSQLEQTQ